MFRIARAVAAMVAAVIVATPPASGGYLVDPTGGEVLWGDSTNVDDITQSRPLGFTFNYFGTSRSAVDVSTNGNLNFSAFDGYTNTGFPFSVAMIAPLWDDLYIFQGSGQKITEKAVAGQYYSVTWDVSQFSNSVPRYQFQVVLFGGTTSINGTTYLPDDIVFAYQRVDADFYDGNATVGLNKGDGTFATLPGIESSGGLLGNSQAALLPTASQQLLLARPDGSGDYGGAFVTAVPEPSTWVLCAGGLACAAWGAMRRGGKRGGSSAIAAMVVPVAFAFCCSHAEGGILSFQVSGSMTTSSSSGGWSAGDPFTASYSFDSLATGVYNPNIPATAYAWTVKSFDFTVAGKTYSMAAGAFGDISVGNNAANAIDRYIVTADGIQHPPLADGLTVSFIQFDFIDRTKAAFTDESLVTSPGVLQAIEQKSGRFRLSNNDQPFFEVTSITAVPEPSSVFLVAAGVAGLACCLRWQRREQCRLLTASSLILVALSGGIAHAELVLSVSPGVVLSPGTATIGGVATGPLNGQVYGPVGYNGAPGGTTGFVTSTFVIPASSSSYQLVWEVSNVGDGGYPSAIAIDNVRITSGSSTAVVFGFESGIPTGFTSGTGSFSGTSAATANLTPTEGLSFAYLDTTGTYDTAMGTNGSRLISAMFFAAAGDILEIDTAFLTTDSTFQYGDYGFAALSTDGGVTPSTVLFTAVAPVPEPSTWVLGAGGVACGAWVFLRRRRTARVRHLCAGACACVAFLTVSSASSGAVINISEASGGTRFQISGTVTITSSGASQQWNGFWLNGSLSGKPFISGSNATITHSVIAGSGVISTSADGPSAIVSTQLFSNSYAFAFNTSSYRSYAQGNSFTLSGDFTTSQPFSSFVPGTYSDNQMGIPYTAPFITDEPIVVNVSAVPEPSTWVLGAGGLACAALGAMRRRLQKRNRSVMAAMIVPMAFVFFGSNVDGAILSFQASGSMTTSSSIGGWSAGDPFTAVYSFDSLATGVYNPNIPATAYAWTVKSFDFTVTGKTFSMAGGAFGDISVGNNAANAIDRYIVSAYGIQHPPLVDGMTVSFIQFDFIDQTKARFSDESLVTSPGVLQAFEQKTGRFVFSDNSQPHFEVAAITAVPEPSSFFLSAAGIAGLAFCLRRQRREHYCLLTTRRIHVGRR